MTDEKKKQLIEFNKEVITLPIKEMAEQAGITANEAIKMIRENPNAFASTLIAGPVGFLIGRKIDRDEKENSKKQ